MLKRALIIDTETQGDDPSRHGVIEVAAILFDLQYKTQIEAFASLLPATSNEAEAINGIPAAVLDDAFMSSVDTWARVRGLAQVSDVILAHNVEFDRPFVQIATGGPLLLRDADKGPEAPWVCTCNDVDWPKQHKPGMGLVALAMAHGLGVSGAHRAMADADLIARLITRACELGMDIQAQLVRGMRPKTKIISLARFEEKEIVKAHGFRWDAAAKQWWRSMPIEDCEALPFKTKPSEVRG